MPNFDFVAPFYDGLVRLVFGKKLWQAQQAHLELIQPDDQVLVLGGGTGRILDWLPACQITYLELSKRMIERAKGQGEAQFIHADFLMWETNQKFDWIICPFFLDCFDKGGLRYALDKIQGFLKEGGSLCVTDFKIENRKQALLVRIMILFFRWIARLEAKKLLELRKKTGNHFMRTKQAEFLNGLVFSDLYSPLKK